MYGESCLLPALELALELLCAFLPISLANPFSPKGRVSSFYGTELQPYTSFKAHPSQDGQVRQLLFSDKGVIALGSRSVHMALRRGPPLWSIR